MVLARGRPTDTPSYFNGKVCLSLSQPTPAKDLEGVERVYWALGITEESGRIVTAPSTSHLGLESWV